ncbi:MAG: ATP-binding cassette domain-containing protein [Gemmatimonadaceae bacterium]|nr:ATP-binding cassette domain-containing protein [Gemmatimonadaceae bacterium]
MIATAALSLTGIHKRFGSHEALRDVGLVLRPGTVHALVGENGAGKSTLMRIVYGMTTPDAGEIAMSGRVVRFNSPAQAIAQGLGMVHQHFTLVPAMTVAENLALGGRGAFRRSDATRRVRDIADRIGFALDPDAAVDSLSIGAQQRVEIAKALSHDASILVLDEPTAVLAPAETEELLHWLREYVARGHAALLVTHKLREAIAVADDVTVLRRGRVVHSGAIADNTARSLADAMVGEGTHVEAGAMPRAVSDSAVIVRAEEMEVLGPDGTPRVSSATFTIRAGEIVGVAAVEGAGQHELLRALAGRASISAGSLVRPDHVGFVPEDRHRDGVLLDRPLVESVVLRDAGARRGIISWRTERERATRLMQDFDVRAPGPQTPMRVLSGGTQQKLVLARELAGDGDRSPALLVAENPTRGLDVRATADVHARVRAASAAGSAVVLFSSDLDEVLLLASRVLVVHAGIVSECAPDRALVGRTMLAAGDATRAS